MTRERLVFTVDGWFTLPVQFIKADCPEAEAAQAGSSPGEVAIDALERFVSRWRPSVQELSPEEVALMIQADSRFAVWGIRRRLGANPEEAKPRDL
mgnify:CR=1 FL=1